MKSLIRIKTFKNPLSIKAIIYKFVNSAGIYAGSYTKANGTLQGLPYWIGSAHYSGQNGHTAIWFSHNRWRIGWKENLGSSIQGLYTQDNLPCRPDLPGIEWIYFQEEIRQWTGKRKCA